MTRPILLVTLNARYAHTSLGLRYISANMGSLALQTRIIEFVIGAKTDLLLEKILKEDPTIVCFALYIWNVNETAALMAMLKSVHPDLPVILGGPEISYEANKNPITRWADYVVSGWGEVTVPWLCQRILTGDAPNEKFHEGVRLPLDHIVMPYAFYTDEDIANRTLYVEASRGCPFQCAFCLSSLEKTSWAFDTNRFLAEMEMLYQRGARSFKFIDRTFNLNEANCRRIMQFFLDKMTSEDPVFVHFEMIPDRLSNTLKSLLVQFPKGSLQLEIGVQTFNPTIQQLINRKQNNTKSIENLTWLKTYTNAHLHTDLIVGLPGESLESFAAGFDQLVRLNPHEIQVSILKRLKGTPILKHSESYGLVFDTQPPYRILKNDHIDFLTMQRLTRFGRYWDLIANSGRFSKTLPLILDNAPFARFMALSDWLYASENMMHGIALDRMASLIHQWLVLQGMNEDMVRITIGEDYQRRKTAQKAHMRQERHAT